jgi:predicted HicB family RNase H-like nuclease
MSETVQELPEMGQPTDLMPAPPADPSQEAYRIASDMYRQGPDWVTFFREILGVEGVVRKMFPAPKDMVVFEQGPVYAEIQQMLGRLRDRAKHPDENTEPTRVITVRLPKSLHEALRHEAYERQTSMNQLCISKLLQIIDNDSVPTD